jgi:drug/metabolite transporter (DMT)-like permease
MGAVSLVMLPFFMPELSRAENVRMLIFLLSWVTTFSLGQFGFFYAQKYIEASRLSSLLGLKIIVLSIMWVLFYDRDLNALQICGILLSSFAAMAMNWSGGNFALRGIAGITLTIICYSLTDFGEFELLNVLNKGSVIKSGITAVLLCYTVLGVLSLPILLKRRWEWKKQLDSIPFAALWLPSQFTLLICFGLLEPVFGNVIQASRGIISVFLGMLVCRLGLNVMENKISGKLWIRRILAALLMVGGIACFSFGKIIS